MMDINVRRASSFIEVTIKNEMAVIDSGLLDEREAIKLATDFIYSAQELLPGKFGEQELKLSEVREYLEEEAT